MYLALLLLWGYASQAWARPLMRKDTRRVVSVSHAAVIAPELAELAALEPRAPRAALVKEAPVAAGPVPQEAHAPHAGAHGGAHGRGRKAERRNELGVWLGWLGGAASALGVLLSFFGLWGTAAPSAACEESRPPSPGNITSSFQIFGITSLSISYGAMISSMTIFVLPKEAEHFYPQETSLGLGLLEFLGALSLLCGPVAGQVSDRIKHPMGRRRPMVLLCSQIAITSTFGCWLSSRYHSSMAFLLCLFVQQIAWHSAHAAHNALLSDLIHPACTGVASSIQTVNVLLGGMLGMLSFQALAQTGLSNDYIYAVQAGVTYLLLPVTQFAAQEAASHEMLLPSSSVSLRNVFHMGEERSPDFILVMWERGFYYACAACKSFLLYFARDVLDVKSERDQALLLAEASVSAVGAAVLGGFLASVLFTRTSMRPQTMACGGSLLLAVGTQFWICIFFHGAKMKKTVLLLFFGIYGLGKGAYMSADLTLAIETLPNPDEASQFLGLWGVSAFLGAGLGGLVMSMILQVFGSFLPSSYGIQVAPGRYCIQGYVCLLLMCFCCQLYVAHLCLQIRRRDERDEKASVRKTNAFLVETDDRCEKTAELNS